MKLLLFLFLELTTSMAFAAYKVGDSATYFSKTILADGTVYQMNYTFKITKVFSDGGYTIRSDFNTNGTQSSSVISVDAAKAKEEALYFGKYLTDCAGNGGATSKRVIKGIEIKTCVVGDSEYGNVPFYSVFSKWSANGQSGTTELIDFSTR